MHVILTELESHLLWYNRSSKVPTTPEDRAVRQLVYKADTTTQLGIVCESKDGGYIAYTTSSLIKCPSLDKCIYQHPTVAEASTFLYDHCLSELYRLVCLRSDMPFTLITKFKERDRVAYGKYGPEIDGDVEQAFKCGIDWMRRSEGFPRRPKWAKFLVQNRDGTLVWFEKQPSCNHNTGKWEGEGRSKPCLLSQEWDTGIHRLAD